MHSLLLALEAGWKILAVGLILGAGLPAIFAFGIRAMAWGAGGAAETTHERPHPVGRALAGLCFFIVLAGVALGLTAIIASGFGKELVFEGILPVLRDK